MYYLFTHARQYACTHTHAQVRCVSSTTQCALDVAGVFAINLQIDSSTAAGGPGVRACECVFFFGLAASVCVVPITVRSANQSNQLQTATVVATGVVVVYRAINASAC